MQEQYTDYVTVQWVRSSFAKTKV